MERPPLADKRVSLAPLTPDEALRLALQVRPDPNPAKGQRSEKQPDLDEGKGHE